MTEKAKKIWVYALYLWAIATMWSMAPMSISAALFAGMSIFGLYQWQGRRELFRFFFRSWYGKTTLFLLLVSMISVVCALAFPPLGMLPEEPFSQFKKVHYFLLPLFVVACFALTGLKRDDQGLWRCIWGMAFFVSIVTIVQFWGREFFPESVIHNRFFRPIPGNDRFHGQGLMYFHLSFACAMGFAYSYACARFLWKKSTDTTTTRVAFFVLSVLVGLAIFYSFSRISWLAVVLVPCFLAFMKKPLCGALLLLGFVIAVPIMWNEDSVFRNRIGEFWHTDLNGFQGRMIVWRSSLEMIKDRPLVGVGFGKTAQYSPEYSFRYFGTQQWFSSHAHNNLLEAFASSGVLGFLAYLAWWGALFWYSLRQYRAAGENEKWFPAASMAAVLAFQINGLTQVNFYDGKSQHAMMLWIGLLLVQEWQNRSKLN